MKKEKLFSLIMLFILLFSLFPSLVFAQTLNTPGDYYVDYGVSGRPVQYGRTVHHIKFDGTGYNAVSMILYAPDGKQITGTGSMTAGTYINFSDTWTVRYIKVTVNSGASIDSIVATVDDLGSTQSWSGPYTTTNPMLAPAPTPTPSPTGSEISLVRGGNTVVPRIQIINYDDPKKVNTTDLLPYQYSTASKL
jgi:hypothetical protein